jgi:hypothetical protein
MSVAVHVRRGSKKIMEGGVYRIIWFIAGIYNKFYKKTANIDMMMGLAEVS